MIAGDEPELPERGALNSESASRVRPRQPAALRRVAAAAEHFHVTVLAESGH